MRYAQRGMSWTDRLAGLFVLVVIGSGGLLFVGNANDVDSQNQQIFDSCFDVVRTSPNGTPLWVVRGWRYVRSVWSGYTWEDNVYPGLVFETKGLALDSIRKWGWKVCDPVHPE